MSDAKAELLERIAALEAERDRLRAEVETAARAQSASEARYRALFDSIDAGFCIIEVCFDDAGRPVDYRFLEGNPAWEEHTGLHGALGKTAREVLPDLEPHWFEIYGRVAATGEPARFESGSEVMDRWFQVYAFRVDELPPNRVALLFYDVTARRRAAQERERLLEALRLERSRLAYVFEQAPSFLAVVRGPDHVFALANEAYYRHVGHRDLVGKPVRAAIPEVVEQGAVALLDRVLRTGAPFVGRETPVRLARTPGAPMEERFVDFAYIPLLEADGAASGIIVHGNDVTEHVLARREIERLLGESERARADAEAARAEAETANRVKADFLASMSHELRTPLNAIGGYVDLVAGGIHGAVNDAQRLALSRVGANQRHLLTLINDVLAFARLEAGHVELSLRPLPAWKLLGEVEPLVAQLAAARGIALSTRECDRTLMLLGDEERIRQILLNLLSNAIKFTPEGGWVVSACEPAGEWVEVQVSDNGLGIPAEEQERIFDPFQQVGRRLDQPQAGVGLGLAISRDLARAMGGELTVRSAPGEGSTFVLRLPRASEE